MKGKSANVATTDNDIRSTENDTPPNARIGKFWGSGFVRQLWRRDKTQIVSCTLLLLLLL
jgi:hypothetical protein